VLSPDTHHTLGKTIRLVKIDHSRIGIPEHHLSMKKEPSPQQALAVQCPTCGAKPEEKCELASGQPRTDPHRDRRLIAADREDARRWPGGPIHEILIVPAQKRKILPPTP